MNTQLLHETLAKSLSGENAFPDVVRVLTAEGVESYRADLVRQEETFYMPDGQTHVEKVTFARTPIAAEFDASGVKAAIAASQAGQIKYPEFLRLAMESGTTSYVVYLKGKRCIYFGRNGDFHVEEFPGAKV
jgi:uncharacterized protein YbcV (DUF1398 family)